MTIVSVDEVIRESPSVYSVLFRHECHYLPGQFVMVWIPGISEIPMSLSYADGRIGFTFRPMGKATKALVGMKKGEKLGIRGAYGSHFSLEGENILFVGGGTGIASIITAIEEAGKRSQVVIGARSRDELFFQERIRKTGASLHVCTDDGSEGRKGFTTELASEIMEKQAVDQVIACGPEAMLYRLALICSERRIRAQFSVERHMKCGIGICDACALDGRLVCRDGPVFSGEELLGTKDFGHYRLNTEGKRVPF